MAMNETAGPRNQARRATSADDEECEGAVPLEVAKRLAKIAVAQACGEAVDTFPPEYSDEALALLFTAEHCDNLRFVAAWGRWLTWTGTRWQQDETLLAFNLARIICRATAAKCAAPSVGKAIASAKTVAAIERLAKADRRHAATVDQWDADPWLLNTPGGVVDLRTGRSRPHRRDDYMTKIAAVAPSGDCPRWLAFLDRVTAHDVELQLFLQRVAGYALTGSTAAHALFFLYGTGANGKSVFINTISGILGEYGKTAPMETFIATSSERHPTDLASLRGARLVTAVETEEGRHWAESKIKTLTGGDRISARFMRQDYFEFTPQFKLVMAGNHKPGLRSVDEAIRRRMHLVPFTVTIPIDERDEELAEKLKPEWPGILGWMVEGCLDWQTEQLSPPEAVRSATDDYLEAEDALGAWMVDCCTVKATFTTPTQTLYGSWKAWAEKAGESVGTMKRFAQALTARNFTHVEIGHKKTAGFAGIGVIAERDPRDEDGSP